KDLLWFSLRALTDSIFQTVILSAAKDLALAFCKSLAPTRDFESMTSKYFSLIRNLSPLTMRMQVKKEAILKRFGYLILFSVFLVLGSSSLHAKDHDWQTGTLTDAKNEVVTRLDKGT